MTLPSELLGLIEALETAKADESRHVTNEERREAPLIYTNRLMALAAARTALIAGIQRYREEGQEALSPPNQSGSTLRPTPPEEPKP